MGRILAIDYGTKRIGIAVSDPLKLIATGLTTVHSKDIMNYLKEYVSTEEVEQIVVGEPRNLDNTPSQIMHLITGFVRKLENEFPWLPSEVTLTRSVTCRACRHSGTRK